MPNRPPFAPLNRSSPASAPTAGPRLRTVLLRALDTVVAFATLRDAEGSAALAPAFDAPAARHPDRAARTAPSSHAHPHRRLLAAAPRPRRPGAVRQQPQACTTPLPTRRSLARTRSAREL
jgi:hypothetical protein